MIFSTDNQQLFRNTGLLQNIKLNAWKFKTSPEQHKWILNTSEPERRGEGESERKPSSMSPWNFRDDLHLSTLTEEKWIKLQNSWWGKWIRNKARKSYKKTTQENQRHVCKGNGTSDVKGPNFPTARPWIATAMASEDQCGSSCKGTAVQQGDPP